MELDCYKLGLNIDNLYLPILVPLALGVLVFVIPKFLRWLRWPVAFIAAIFNLHIAYRLFAGLEERVSDPIRLISLGDLSIKLSFFLDNWNRILLLLAGLFGFLIVLYSLRYMKGKGRLREYYAYLLLTIAFANGALLANNLIILVLFWEALTALLFFLITIGGKPARHPAGKSFVILGFADAALLLGVLLVWRITDSLSMTEINVKVGSAISYVAYVLILIGALAKAGAMPLHTWIPSAAEGAPISVMAYLPGALDKILGIYLLARITVATDMTRLFTLKGSFLLPLLLIICGATIIFAVLAAMVQHDLRKLLSFHAVSQVGYMVMGIGTGVPVGVIGGLFHMVNNTIYKSCLFLGTGAVEKETGKVDLEKLGGLARYMPATFLTMLIAALAISGVPPLNGFASKWLIYQGTIAAASHAVANPETAPLAELALPKIAIIALIAAMFGSALTLASFVKVVYSLFLGRKPDDLAGSGPGRSIREAPFSMSLPMIVLAALCIFLGVFAVVPVSGFLTHLGLPGMEQATDLTVFSAISRGLSAGPAVWQSAMATIFIIVALAIGVIVFLFGRISKKVKRGDIFYGGERLSSEDIRVPGTDFYGTIENMGVLETLYGDSEGGVFDPYVVGGRAGERIVEAGRRVHNGVLSTYLAFCVLGLAVILFFLLRKFLELG